MLKKAPFLFFALLVGFVSPQEESQMLQAAWKLSSAFTPQRLESLVARFSLATHGLAFRFIGVEEDFFHGHVLFERTLHDGQMLLHPRAILYHTQEEAHKAHWEKTVDAKYDYLNVTTRNWFQWLNGNPEQDGVRIENAREYLDFAQKEPGPFFDETAAPQKEQHYTIHAKNLDPNKLGFQLAGELQFEFYREGAHSPYFQNPEISICIEGQDVVLFLSTNSAYISRELKK